MKYYYIMGASSGVGRALAKELIGQGHYVYISARRREKLLELEQRYPNQCMAIEMDATRKDSIENSFETIAQTGNKLDGLIYCVGIAYRVPVKLVSEEDLRQGFDTNFFGYFYAGQLFALKKYSNTGACIIGLSSYAAIERSGGMSYYPVTKEAMNVQSQIFAKEFAKRKIRSNTIMPALIQSKMQCEINEWSQEELDEIREKQIYGAIPIENVVGTICFLLSDTAAYMTGDVITMSAGYGF